MLNCLKTLLVTVLMSIFWVVPVLSQTVIPDEAELSSDRYYHDRSEESDYTPLHRSHYLRMQPEIQRAYQQYLDEYHEWEVSGRILQQIQEYDIGDRQHFYVINFADSEGSVGYEYDEIEFELRGSSDRVRIWIEQEEFGETQVSQQVVDDMMQVMDEATPPGSINPDLGLFELNRELFGEYPDANGSGILNVLITDIQEAGQDDEDRDLITLGFFNPADLNPNENNYADIIYLNSNPFIYDDDGPGSFDASDWHSTLSHEMQHLIHANGDYAPELNTFQNEGQSELAEILTGYRPRPMNFLAQPEERTGMVNSSRDSGLFRWRDGRNEVLQDYERAGLLHTYIAERIGPYNAGSITHSGATGLEAYRKVTGEEDLEWEELLTDFHITNLINTEHEGTDIYEYGYHSDLENLRARNFPRTYTAARPDFVQNRQVQLQFGGVKYTRWVDISAPKLTFDSDRGVRHRVWYRRGSDATPQLETIDSGQLSLDGDISSMTLISMNVDPAGNESNPTPRSFTYTGNWDTGETLVDRVNYAANDTLTYFTIPDTSYSETNHIIGTRLTSRLNGHLNELTFRVQRTNEAIRGEGTLHIRFHDRLNETTFGGNQLIYPDFDHYTNHVSVDFEDIGTGHNTIALEQDNWVVEKDRDYFITFEAERSTPDAELRLLLDAGQNDQLMQDEETRNYYEPARTIVRSEEVGSTSLGMFSDNNNLYLDLEMIGTDPDFDEQFPDKPLSEEQFVLEDNFPNPFNPVTNIRYSLHMEIDVNLELYDVTGRKITTLVDQRQEPGSYTFEFDASAYNLASGVYLYRFRAGSFRETGKMMLVK